MFGDFDTYSYYDSDDDRSWDGGDDDDDDDDPSPELTIVFPPAEAAAVRSYIAVLEGEDVAEVSGEDEEDADEFTADRESWEQLLMFISLGEAIDDESEEPTPEFEMAALRAAARRIQDRLAEGDAQAQAEG